MTRSSAASESGGLLGLDGVDERVGVAMHDKPVSALAAIYLGNSERPVLVGHTADLSVLALNHDEHDSVVPGVGL